MSEHAPKQAALEAYARGVLSAVGRRRIEQHTKGCSVCQATLASIERYEALRREARAEGPAELDWERFERALDRQLQAQPERKHKVARLIAVSLPVLALAATLLLGWIAISSQRHEQQAAAVRVPTAQPQLQAEAPEREAESWVTLASAQASLGARPAVPGDLVREGDVLRTGAGAELHVAVEGGTGLVLESDSEARVVRLREHHVEFELLHGSLFQRVKKLTADDSYEVGVTAYKASVRGTHFRVEQRQAAGVSVFEGRVVVTQGGRQIADLTAGQTWSSGAAHPGPGQDREVHNAARAEEEGWTTLRLPVVEGVSAWVIDGSQLSNTGGLTLRVPTGRLDLQFQDLQGALHTVQVPLTAGDAALNETEIRAQVARQTEPTGYLDPAQIQPVVRAGLDLLRRCYERSLRRDPRLVGKFKLAIRVAPDGRVARAAAQGEATPLPIDLEQCVELEARSWRFPRPQGGGSVAFEVPLNLKASN